MAFPLLLLAALSTFALIPLASPHFFASSDGLYHVFRAIEVDRCLQDGVLICRWMPDQFLGFGTPLLNLYSPLTYYLIAAFHLLGLGWVAATKLSIAAGLLLSGIAAFGYAADFLSRRAALLAAVVYVYVPYHLVNAYYRGDLPEFFAMAWFPAILWAFGRTAHPGPLRTRLPYAVAAALSYAGLVLTHNLSAFIYTAVLALYCAFLLLRGRVERHHRTLLGLARPGPRCCSARRCWPTGCPPTSRCRALLEKHLIQLDGLLYVSHADHFPWLRQILPNRPFHTYGFIFREATEYGYRMGFVQVALGGLGAAVALLCYRRLSVRARGEALFAASIWAAAFWFTRPPRCGPGTRSCCSRMPNSPGGS